MLTRNSDGPVFPARAMARTRYTHAVIDAFEQIETARQAMQEAERELADLIRHDPEGEWQDSWARFLADGGVTCDELCRWMVQGKQIRKDVARRHHVRLIVSKQ